MSASAQYNELLNRMRKANVGYKPPAVIDDVLNDKEIPGKGALKGVSSQLLGGSLAGSLKSLVKNKAALAKRLGIKEEDIDGIIEAASKGDLGGALSSSTEAAIGAANQTIQNTIGSATSALRTGGKGIAEAIGSPKAQAREVYDNLDPEDFLGLTTKEIRGFSQGRIPARFQEGAPKATFTPAAQAQAAEQAPTEGAEYAANLKQQVSETLQGTKQDLDPFSTPSTLSQEAQGALKATTDEAANTAGKLAEAGKAVSTGEKAVEGIEGATEASAAADFDPVNLAITGALGLAGVIGGLFVKTHHVENRAAPEILPVNYGSQLF